MRSLTLLVALINNALCAIHRSWIILINVLHLETLRFQENSANLIFASFIKPYGLSHWGRTSSCALSSLKTARNHTVRIIANLNKLESTAATYEELDALCLTRFTKKPIINFFLNVSTPSGL